MGPGGIENAPIAPALAAAPSDDRLVVLNAERRGGGARASLLLASAGARLALVAALVVPLWLAVIWALS